MSFRARLAVVAAAIAAAVIASPVHLPAQNTGTVSGTVYDAATGEPLPGAGVTVLETEQRTQSGDDGTFRIAVAPGTYAVRIAAPAYSPANLEGLVVPAGGTADASASLNPTGAVIDVLEIVAEAHQASEATQLLERKMASYVSDNIGAQMIKQSPDSSAAEVVTRLPAITVSSDDFIFIRGLGERYSSALLNGSRLPSTDPDKRVVSLDLFPAEFIESLSISKSYSPDLPGDFAGGLVDIRLKKYPEELTWGVGVSTSASTESTFQDFNTYRGSDLDYLGFGLGTRELPGIFGDEKLDESATSTDSRQRALHGALRNVWAVDEITPGPNLGVKANVGNRFGPFGFLLGASYSNEFKVYQQRERNRALGPDAIDDEGNVVPGQVDFATYNESTFETGLGAVLSAGAEINEDHSLSLHGFLNRNTSDLTQYGLAQLSSNLDTLDVFNTQFQYRVDQLSFGQLGGTHRAGPFDVDWRSAFALTTRDEPDRRFVRQGRERGTSDAPALNNKSPSLIRLFNGLEEWMSDSAVDATLPFEFRDFALEEWNGEEAKLKAGLAYTYRDRNFEQRRFQINQFDTSGLDTTLPVEQLLVPENIGVGSRNPFEFREAIDPSDDFDASQEIAGTYGLVDVPLIPRSLRFIGGARFEYSLIRTIGKSNAGDDASARIEDYDVMPAGNFVYSPREDMNVRFGISQTVSRPEFRELSETFFPEADGDAVTLGNSELESTKVNSYDLRWEWFLSDAELLSFGVFKKDIPNAIETVSISSTSSSVESFANSTAALWGVEFEVRKNFGMLVEPLRGWTGAGAGLYELENLSFLTNVSLIRSTANIETLSGDDCLVPDPPLACQLVQTNSNRALQGQADLVANAALQYDNADWGTYRLLYNHVGETIAAAGINGLPDILATPSNTLDFVWNTTFAPFDVPLNTKLSVENILNDDYHEVQGPLTIDRYEPGVKFGVGVSYTF